MVSLDKSSHGWEGINNGGEIYGNSQQTSIQDNEKEYLRLVKEALKVSLEDTPDSYNRAKEIIEYAKKNYGDYTEVPEYIQGDGSEIAKILEGIETDEDLEKYSSKKI